MANGNNSAETFIFLWLMFDFGIAHKINKNGFYWELFSFEYVLCMYICKNEQ